MQHHLPCSISSLSLSHSCLASSLPCCGCCVCVCVCCDHRFEAVSLARTPRTQQLFFVGRTTCRAGTQAYPLPGEEEGASGSKQASGLQLKMAIKRGNSLTIEQFTRHKQNEQHRPDNFQLQLQFAFSRSSGQNVHVTSHHAALSLLLSLSPCSPLFTLFSLLSHAALYLFSVKFLIKFSLELAAFQSRVNNNNQMSRQKKVEKKQKSPLLPCCSPFPSNLFFLPHLM